MEELMRKLIILSFAILLSVACMGQEKLTLKSRVVDSKTRNDVPGVTVQLLSSDSIVIESLVANNHWTRDDQEGYSSIFRFDVPRLWYTGARHTKPDHRRTIRQKIECHIN